MIATGNYYPYSSKPADVFKAQEADRENFFFNDVQSREECLAYALKKLEREGIQIKMESEDLALLKEHTILHVLFPQAQK